MDFKTISLRSASVHLNFLYNLFLQIGDFGKDVQVSETFWILDRLVSIQSIFHPKHYAPLLNENQEALILETTLNDSTQISHHQCAITFGRRADDDNDVDDD